MKLAILFILTLFSSFALSSEVNGSLCNSSDKFFPYKAAKKAEKSDYIIEAFNMYCQLAFNGDYRAQYKLASFYSQGIKNYVSVDKEFAYLWAKLANSQVQSRKKSLLVDKLAGQLTNSQRVNADKNFLVFVQKIPSGRRIDQEYEPIDLAKELRLMEKRRKNEFVGSRIKKDEMPKHLKIVLF
ncbi:hypothetical protein [Litorilituus lipolyticus]|uniref:Sel1 repeat family protein n=1 Tax=Litorilituus lipolyticus TaxID=2491017 RepID=A0A502KW49_9GAMM|nr:hypothetical protein [Litorilituus lipolyticus]TPH15716.1 hypothetical protein EPA86_09085 [Litorilituus lipolyticus]